jgi:hypothetical protein
MSLVRRANWPSNEQHRLAIFGCPRCHAQYKVIRRQIAPGIKPECQDCDQEFLPRDDGEWLVYERVNDSPMS